MNLDSLLGEYESGRITRRQLLGTLAAAMATGGPAANARAAEPAIGTARQLNHVTMFVQDVGKSVAFYQELFGMPVLTPQDPGINLQAGSGFLGIYPAQAGRPSAIDHVCLSLDGFDADAVHSKLTGRGLKASIRMRGETKELYFTDPDNIRIQLQDVSYIGGSGPLGDRKPGR